ncbi:glycosyltransferase [Clostridium sp. BJN0001]|uniref:glycosyltransferase n=1 Tax=Clostridium sp. BJN0001 TaxID=2930219 RepID=UPI001FD5BA0F|nr:glycosyltransferase [Clostridium sp. BJN0001]
MVICTSICANYLPKALVLAKSVKKYIKDATFVVSLVEREIPKYAKEHKEFDYVVLGKDLGYGNFDRFIFKHSIVEASTAVKGQLFRFLYEKFPDENQFIYLDPDVRVYDDFTELKELLNVRPIIVCPHLLEPGNVDMELSSTAHGVYNLGFLAVNRSEEAQKFINWWAERLHLFCYDDIQKGIFTDQKWIDLAPCFFDVEIFKHKGYDFATWSLMNSDVNVKNNKIYIGNDPLRFIHFSGYDSGTIDWAIDKWLPNKEKNPFVNLYKEYSTELSDAGQAQIGKSLWTYQNYNSGEKISNKIREEYRKDYDLQYSIESPFEYSNEWFQSKLNINTNSGGIIAKSIKVCKEEGIIAFIKKALKKLLK